MSTHRGRYGPALALTLALFLAGGPLTLRADAAPAAEVVFLRKLRALMAALRPESVADAARIQDAYGGTTPVAMLPDREALAAAIAGGAIDVLPAHAPRFNVRPRLRGAHPIGQHDLAHQPLYVAAHPGTLGCLLQVAARVRSAPLDVTSLVRHRAYQARLQQTNANARTALPVHTFGLAFDISVLNVPLRTAAEIRDVLREMRDAGDLFFVAETRQLVFHVVPAPDRLTFYAEVYRSLASLPVPPLPAATPPRNLLAEAALDSSGDDERPAWLWALTSTVAGWRAVRGASSN